MKFILFQLLLILLLTSCIKIEDRHRIRSKTQGEGEGEGEEKEKEDNKQNEKAETEVENDYENQIDLDQYIQLFKHVQGGEKLNSLSLIAQNYQDSYIKLQRSQEQSMTVGLIYETGSLSFQNQNLQLIEVNNDQIIVKARKLKLRTLKIRGIYNFQNIPQWRLLSGEYFSEPALGWSNNTVTQCGGVSMLGGYGQFAGGETRKRFKGMVKHSIIKISATIHFIDGWKGQFIYLKLDTGKDKMREYVWTEKYDTSSFDRDQGVSICGKDVPEFRFSQRVDITLDHSDPDVEIVFGSTLNNDPYEASWGISDFKCQIK